MIAHASISNRSIRRLTEAARQMGTLRIAARLSGEAAKKDFTGFAVLSTDLFPLKKAVSNHKELING